MALLTRIARRWRSRFDLIVSANNEVDLGGAGIQYVHYPYFQDQTSMLLELDKLSGPRRLLRALRGRVRPWMLIPTSE